MNYYSDFDKIIWAELVKDLNTRNPLSVGRLPPAEVCPTPTDQDEDTSYVDFMEGLWS